ncbi:hypothetical protein IFM89_035426 [Coptis chinensis]|uniref:Uncharacterized protein n=1 Tax=Coptis chinensis TaxID=261450 RepID=A0A835HIX1_9MAGN|nr:hypothetical protein IFM89_035426 [Coptis chinensis]
MKHKEGELAMFPHMRKEDMVGNSFLLAHNSKEFDASPGSKHGSSPIFKIVSSPKACKSVGDKNDYDWLLTTPPVTPLFSSLEMESQQTNTSQNKTTKAFPAALKSKFANSKVHTGPEEECAPKQISSPGSNSSSAESSSTASSSGGQVSAASRRQTLSGNPAIPLSSKSTQSAPPTSRAALPSNKPTISKTRSTTSSAKNSTPTDRPTLAPCMSKSRSGTTNEESTTQLTAYRVSVPHGRSSSVGKLAPKTTPHPTLPNGSSTMRSRPQIASEMHGLSTDASSNPSTSLTKREVSASKRRPVVSRAYSNDGDNLSPAMIGTKMVERVVNMRKLAPPRQDNQCSIHPARKSSSQSSAGFGRTLSKSSLDMALRHMDIGRRIPSNLRPSVTNVADSSTYTLKSGPARSRVTSVSVSPLAMSSSTRSEFSVISTTPFSDDSEPVDDLASERRG